MSTEEKIKLLEELMDADEGTLEIDMYLSDVEEWDSLAALSLIVEMKQRFNMIITTDVIKGFRTVRDICMVIPE